MKNYYMIQFKNKLTNRWRNLYGLVEEEESQKKVNEFRRIYPTYEIRKKFYKTI